MEKRIAVITGSYKGLGLEIAKKLALIENIQVIISSRVSPQNFGAGRVVSYKQRKNFIKLI